MNDLLDILVNFGGGKGGEASGTVVRFLLPVFFWLILAFIAGSEWRRGKERKDLFMLLAALAGTVRELLMFMAEYGSHRGHFSFESLYRFYPPFEHAATMLVGILISYAFMRFGTSGKSYQSRFITISTIVTLVIYALTAVGWPAILSVDPKTSFAMYGGDLAFRIAASLILGFALTGFVLDRMRGGRIAAPLIAGIGFLLLDELLMIANIATMEHNVAIFAPIRHNLHIWAIPFFIATYWSELDFTRKQYELELEEQHQQLEGLNSTLEERIAKAVGDLRLRDWFKSGQNELNLLLRGDKSSTELADKVLTFLVGYLGAGVGVFYLYDYKGEYLEIISTYALSGEKRLHERISLGEGLAGQAALERKTIHITAVPHNYLPIGSALGESDPLNIVVMPVMNNSQLRGVIELGSFKLFKSNDMEFLNQSAEGIAIALSANRSRQMVNELLEQTQAQAEELRVQQEELQQTNEELQERTRMLEQHRELKTYHPQPLLK
jgi:putative methionine-R-sulfoxide reductase with GAF domain